MKITICGSIAFIDQMYQVKNNLEDNGHTVFLPPQTVEAEGEEISVKEFYEQRKAENAEDELFEIKSGLMKKHYRKIEASDVVLVLNYGKNGIDGYIGGNTFLEMGVADFLDIPIYMVNPIPEMRYTEEIKAMAPVVLEDLDGLN